ncbi:MAG: DUF4340 domain-containing protein [Betaproteobacteria bacterium]|nr:DUF4340 domain-containing protein [Betaproteobacteria bacterium]
MKNRWLLNLLLLATVASIVAFLYLRPKNDVENNASYEVSSYKMAEFNAISIEFPAHAAVSFEKVDGYWHLTAPYKTRADLASVQRIMSIIAATSATKIATADIEKYGLSTPSVKLKLYRSKDNFEEFLFGTHNPITDEQYISHKNVVYLLANSYAEAASTQAVELIDKTPLKPTEKVAGFNFSHLEQWEESKLNLDIVNGQWKVSMAKAKPVQNELNEWLDFNWKHNPAKSVELYMPDRKTTYPSFEVKLADGKTVHFDKIQESPDLIIGRPDEGVMYSFPQDTGFVMLNPPLNLP